MNIKFKMGVLRDARFRTPPMALPAMGSCHCGHLVSA